MIGKFEYVFHTVLNDMYLWEKMNKFIRVQIKREQHIDTECQRSESKTVNERLPALRESFVVHVLNVCLYYGIPAWFQQSDINAIFRKP